MNRILGENALGGRFTFPGTALTVQRMGYGAMQLAGPGVFGPPKEPEGAIKVLREAGASGVNHIDMADFYGPHITNQTIRQALHPYPTGLVIVTKLGAVRPADGSWQPASSPKDLAGGVHDNLRNLGLEALDIVNYRAMGSIHGPKEGSIAEQVTVLTDLKRQGLIRGDVGRIGQHWRRHWARDALSRLCRPKKMRAPSPADLVRFVEQ